MQLANTYRGALRKALFQTKFDVADVRLRPPAEPRPNAIVAYPGHAKDLAVRLVCCPADPIFYTGPRPNQAEMPATEVIGQPRVVVAVSIKYRANPFAKSIGWGLARPLELTFEFRCDSCSQSVDDNSLSASNLL
jgi:hypothetical protein